MKILHVIPSISPVRGGPSRAVLEMVAALRRQGIDAEIATTNDDGDSVFDLPLQELIFYPVRADQTSSASVPIRFFARFSPEIAAIREYAFSSDLTQWLWEHMRDYDLIHVHAIFSYPSTVAMAIARVQKIPYLVRPLGQLCEWSLQQRSRKKQLYLRLIERSNLCSSQGLHFTSIQEQQEALPLELSIPNFVLPHGLTLPPLIPDASQRLHQHLNIPADQPIILFLSRLHPKKGLEALIMALQAMKSYPWTLILAGGGSADYEAEIDYQLQMAGMEQQTKRLGFVDGDLKHLLLQGADLFALPSHSENFGIAALEAMAAGLPVLLSTEVALSSFVQEHQLGWITSCQPESIAVALRQFFHQPDAAKEMGDRARHLIHQQFTWEPIASTLIQHYQRCLHQPSFSSFPLCSPTSLP